jgi:hypothetical protein
VPDLSAEFSQFRAAHLQELKEVEIFLAEPMEDEIVLLEGAARRALAYYSRMNTLHAWAISYQKEAVNRKRPAKSSENSEDDRRAMTESSTREERRLRDTISGHVDSLDRMISLCQTLIKAHTSERVKTGMAQ